VFILFLDVRRRSRRSAPRLYTRTTRVHIPGRRLATAGLRQPQRRGLWQFQRLWGCEPTYHPMGTRQA